MKRRSSTTKLAMASALGRTFGYRAFFPAQQRNFLVNAVLQGAEEVFSMPKADCGELEEKTFEELLENSQLMKLRRPSGRTVIGKITDICNDDFYVDFGGKFYTVVKKPAMNPEEYEVGKHVRILLKKLEMTGHFLGQRKHITLLEADGWLLGLDRRNTPKS